MMKKLLVLFIPLVLSGCLATLTTVGYVAKEQYYEYFSDKFNDTEYEHLVKLNLAASNHSCKYQYTADMKYHADFLNEWSVYRNNANINDIYKRVKSLTDELYNRGEKVSPAYCDIKTVTIDKVTKRILKVYGKRR